MRSVFLRLFSSIVSVTLIILALQAGLLFMANERMQNEWTQEVYDSYLQRVKQVIEEQVPEGGWTTATLVPELLKSADDRVSGLMFRDGAGELVGSFGKTGRGILLPVPTDFTVSVVQDAAKVVFKPGSFPRGNTSDDEVVVKVADGEAQPHKLPPEVREQDVVGTIRLFVGNVDLGSVDVLTYTPMTYKFTSGVVRSLVISFLITIPVAVLISLVAAYCISRKSVRTSETISAALYELAEGSYDVHLGKKAPKGFEKLFASIIHLSQRLKDHQRARQAWLCSISHDLNTPVTSMKLLLDGIQDGIFPLNEESIRLVAHENDVLQRRIQSVVTFSTLQSPDTQATFSDVDTLDLVDSVLGSFEQDCSKRVQVQVQCPVVCCDFSLMTLACRELLKNAFAASSSPVQWNISGSSDAGYEMMLSNEGDLSGDLTGFFEPWTRGDASRTANGGSGLGLSIVGQVMRLQGGTATIVGSEAEKLVQVILKWGRPKQA